MLMCVIDKEACSFKHDTVCTREEGHCEPCITECLTCIKTIPGMGTHYCASYPVPQIQWRRGICPLSSHTNVNAETVVKLNPLKASKRGWGG